MFTSMIHLTKLYKTLTCVFVFIYLYIYFNVLIIYLALTTIISKVTVLCKTDNIAKTPNVGWFIFLRMALVVSSDSDSDTNYSLLNESRLSAVVTGRVGYEGEPPFLVRRMQGHFKRYSGCRWLVRWIPLK